MITNLVGDIGIIMVTIFTCRTFIFSCDLFSAVVLFALTNVLVV